MKHIAEKLTHFILVIFLLGVCLAIPSRRAGASSDVFYMVNSNTDADNASDGFCSLREAITAALSNINYNECVHGGSNFANISILFSTFGGSRTITLASALPDITSGVNLSIDNNSGLPILIDGANVYRVFDITDSGAVLTLRTITVQHGSVSSLGGGVLNMGTLNIYNSAFLNNTAGTGDGGAINNNTTGTATIFNTTFSGNSAGYGGAVMNNSGTITLYNSTFSGNTAAVNGSAVGIYKGGTPSPTTTIYNTIMANSSVAEDCWNGAGYASVMPVGHHNIIETTTAGVTSCASITTSSAAPQLGAQISSPAYFPLNAGSPAIDAGDNVTCQHTIQDGDGDNIVVCDIGAYEAPDTFAPTVFSIIRANSNPANLSSVDFTVTFSEPVCSCAMMQAIGVNSFTLTTTGSISGATVSSVSGSDNIYTVTVNTGSGDGTIRLDVPVSAAISDIWGNNLIGGYIGGEAYNVDKTSPAVSSSLRMQSSTTNAASVNFKVAFNEPVTGVDSGDFSLTTTGVSGASITGLTGSGASYNVTVNTGLDSGNIRIDLSDNDTIMDAASNLLGGNGQANGNFTTGEVYTIDKTPPIVSSITRMGVNPSNAASVNFSVSFSEPVNAVDVSDFGLTTTGVTGASITSITGSGATYTVAVNTGSGNGTMRLNIPNTATIVDPAGNALTGLPFTTGEVYTINKTLTLTLNSIAAQDGWILESGETSNLGGTLNSAATTFNLGDDAARKQYRAILSFGTGAGLPDNAIIATVTLRVKKNAVVGGGNPLTMFQGFMLDIKNGPFGAYVLQTADFQTAASHTYGPFNPTLISNWYSLNLTVGKAYINKLAANGGLTQIRMRFKLDDNNNTVANYLSLYSGNAVAASCPQLIIGYYIP